MYLISLTGWEWVSYIHVGSEYERLMVSYTGSKYDGSKYERLE